MKSIKTKIVLVVLMCSLISTVICGSIGIVESSRAAKENSADIMKLLCENQGQKLDGMMRQVSQSVDTLYDLAVSELDDFQKFKTDAAYVDAYSQRLAPMLLQTAVHTQGAMSVYIRYNPQFTEPTSGLFYTRDSADSEFQEIEPTDFSMYEPDDLEHVGWYYIPVGEVFTSPVLKGTNGRLHVTQVYLNGMKYLDLELEFADGMVVNYSCRNFEAEEENRAFLKENLLKHHDTLPLGEFAIGTNTTAYQMGRDYQIQDKLPILIAEKTGPHFAVGDTCYSCLLYT